MLTVNNISIKLALDYSTFQRHKVAFYNSPLDRVLRICRFPQKFCSSGHLVIFIYLSHLLARLRRIALHNVIHFREEK